MSERRRRKRRRRQYEAEAERKVNGEIVTKPYRDWQREKKES